MSSDETAIVITLGLFAMITFIVFISCYFSYKSKTKTNNYDPQEETLHPLHKFRSFDERIRKIEDRIKNLEILIEPDEDSHEKT